MRKEVDSGNILGAVSHSCLNKLPSYGINNKELHWFTDCLFCRTQSVQFKGVLSEANPIFSGVPQGSILGPLLFSIHFNDVHTPLQRTSIITYACCVRSIIRCVIILLTFVSFNFHWNKHHNLVASKAI